MKTELYFKRFLSFLISLAVLMGSLSLIGAFTVSAEVTAKNVLLGLTPVGDYDPGSIKNLKDGKIAKDTNFANLYGKVSSYIQYNFNEATEINTVKIYIFDTANENDKRIPKDIAVDVKRPDGSWVRVAERHNYTLYGAGNEKVKDRIETALDDGKIALGIPFYFKTVKASSIRFSFNKQRNIDTDGNDDFLAVEATAYNDASLDENYYTGTAKAEDEKYNIPVPKSDNLLEDTETVKVSNSGSLEGGADRPLSNINDGKNTGNDLNGAVLLTFGNSDTAYYQFDFTDIKTVNNVMLYYNTAETGRRPGDYAVDVKLYDGTWKRVAELHNDSDKIKAVLNGTEHSLDFNFETTECAALRITANKAYTENEMTKRFDLQEIEAYYDPFVTESDYTGTAKAGDEKYNIPVPKSDNYLLNGKVTASNSDDSRPSSRLTDGKSLEANNLNGSGLCYYSKSDNKTNGNAWFKIDLADNKAHRINQVVLYFDTTPSEKVNRPKDIAIDLFTGDRWIRAAEKHDVDFTSINVLTFNFNVTECTEIRITGLKPDDGDNFALNEAEAYYVDNVQPDALEKPASIDKLIGVLGDANYDLKVDAVDLAAIRSAILNEKIESSFDVNVDYNVDVRDLIFLRKLLCKLKQN